MGAQSASQTSLPEYSASAPDLDGWGLPKNKAALILRASRHPYQVQGWYTSHVRPMAAVKRRAETHCFFSGFLLSPTLSPSLDELRVKE